jgi:hypothetical protein
MSETNMYEQMVHRLFLVTKIDEDLEEQNINIEQKIDDEKINFKKEIKELKEEIGELKIEINLLIKKVYSIGEKLKEKVDKRSLEKMNEVVDKIKFEEILHKNELKKHFDNYAKFEEVNQK